MITSIYIGTDKLDLFKDDNIQLKSSVVEIQDITKIFTDSTNSFSVPATDNNNRIFKHFYNANLVDGWDVFNKVDTVIELSGSFYKQGKVKLTNVITRSQKPVSYEIQFYGLLTSLKDLLGNDKLSDLDMSSYNYNYNGTSVVLNLIKKDLAPYDLINTPLSNKRLIYNSDSSVNNTDSVINIANNNTSLDSGLPFEKTNSSILNIRIIEAIESKYNITFSRDFFGTSVFNNLYLLLNGNDTENQIEEQVVFDDDDFTNDPTLYNDRVLLSTDLTYRDTLYLKITIRCQGSNLMDEFTSSIRSNGVEIHSVTANGNSSGLYVYKVKKTDFSTFENLTFYFKSASVLDYKFIVDRYEIITFPTILFYKSETLYNDLTGVFDVSSRMPDLKIIDYLKGIFQVFKLVAINTSKTDIFIDSLENYYRSGEVKEITKYVDYKQVSISTGKIFNEINYKFKEPNTLLQSQFFNKNGVYYGDLEYKLVDVNGNKVDGDSIDIELPFENMVYEKLLDLNRTNDFNFIYGYMVNDSLEPVNVKAHLHYVTNVATGSEVKILDSNSSYVTWSSINMPTHTLGVNTPQYSTVFGNEFNEYNGNIIENTLFSNFHKDYINEAFSDNKRLYKVKCKNLPINFLINLKLNDVLEIKGQYYRINKYNLNLITKECDFELYNIKELNLTPLVSVTTDSTDITTDSTVITTDVT